MNVKSLIELCKDKIVWIQTHNFPDPDAIASAFGLQQLLKHFDISARICHEGQIDKLSSTKMLSLCGITMFPYSEISEIMNEDDMIILVDCQKNSGNTTDLIGDEMAVIDHHPTFVKIEYKYEDLRITGACSSLIADYYRAIDLEPDTKTATALLYGLRMDTLQLSRGVTEYDIEMYFYLFRYADQDLLRQLETNNMEFADLQAYGSAIENFRCFGKVCFSYLDFACPDALVASLSDFLLALIEIEVVIVYAKRERGYKFSIRSERDDVDAGDLANRALSVWGNGGGHATMAGGFVDSKVFADVKYLPNYIQEHFIQLIQKDWPQIL